MTKVYQCGNCDNKIKYGAKYCDECGTKLEWPEEIKDHPKRTKQSKAPTSVRLPVNPENLYRFASKDGVFTFRIYQLLLAFCTYCGLILLCIVSNREKKINKWLDSLRTEEGCIEELRKPIQSIRRCGIWAIVLNIIGSVEIFAVIANPDANWLTILIGAVSILIGIATGIYMVQSSDKILEDIKSGKSYEYSFDDLPTIMKMADSKESADNSTEECDYGKESEPAEEYYDDI